MGIRPLRMISATQFQDSINQHRGSDHHGSTNDQYVGGDQDPSSDPHGSSGDHPHHSHHHDHHTDHHGGEEDRDGAHMARVDELTDLMARRQLVALLSMESLQNALEMILPGLEQDEVREGCATGCATRHIYMHSAFDSYITFKYIVTHTCFVHLYSDEHTNQRVIAIYIYI